MIAYFIDGSAPPCVVRSQPVPSHMSRPSPSPSNFSSLSHFEIQTFTNTSAEKVAYIFPPASENYSDTFIYHVGDALRFKAPVHGAKTSSSAGGPRVELREVYKGVNATNRFAWRFGEAAHSIRVTLELNQLPDSGRIERPGEVCVLQLHTTSMGASSVPAMVLAHGTYDTPSMLLYSPMADSADNIYTGWQSSAGYAFGGGRSVTLQLNADEAGTLTFCGVDGYGRTFHKLLPATRFLGESTSWTHL